MEIRCKKLADQDLGISLGSIYEVFAMVLFENELFYLIYDDHDYTYWISPEYFDIVSNVLPIDWHFGLLPDTEGQIFVWGGNAFFSSPNYYNDLIEREGSAQDEFLLQRKLITEKIEQYDVVKSRTAIPFDFIPIDSFGMVTSKVEEPKGLYEVTFYKKDGSEFPPVTVPRDYIKLDSKS